ncbi:MAG TPA: ECF transporter S component [Erysipelothrix sp.]|nr:ECF transporter S component [Erysipelothrix sp.]
MKKLTTRNLVLIGLLSALSYLFFMWEIVIIDPLQFDFSDLFVMIAGYTMGIGPGIMVAFLKNLLHFMFRNAQFVGELTNFVYAVLIMVPLVKFTPKQFIKRIVLNIAIILFVTLSMSVFNYFIAMPLYNIGQEVRLSMIKYTFIPFNIIKTAVLVVIFTFIYPLLDNLS